MKARSSVTTFARLFARVLSLILEQDSSELAALVREGMDSRQTKHKNGDIQKILARVRLVAAAESKVFQRNPR
jgi:hypothetical protein